jgi:hypothetical protein
MPVNNPGSSRLTAAQLSAIRPTGEEFDVVAPAVPGSDLKGRAQRFETPALPISLEARPTTDRVGRIPRDRTLRSS